MGDARRRFFSRGRAVRQLYQMELSVVVLSVSVILSSSSLFISLLVFRFIFQFLNTLSACHVYQVERVAS